MGSVHDASPSRMAGAGAAWRAPDNEQRDNAHRQLTEQGRVEKPHERTFGRVLERLAVLDAITRGIDRRPDRRGPGGGYGGPPDDATAQESTRYGDAGEPDEPIAA